MKTKEKDINYLYDGIDLLCNNDENTKELILPRKDEIIVLLEKYIKEIETFNSAYGLVGTLDHNELIIRHILDSLAPLGIIYKLVKHHCSLLTVNCSLKIADAGSGAGLPGIPLAVCLPDCDFTLIERMGKRAKFLFSAAAVLGLKNISIEEKELEKTDINQFDLITFRAFSQLENKILKTLFRVCKENGIIAAYKGQREKIDEELSVIKELGINWEVIPYKVPFLEEQRHLVVARV